MYAIPMFHAACVHKRLTGSFSGPGIFVSLHLYPAPQDVEPRSPVWMPSRAILAALGAGLFKILHPNFREYPFYALG
jgi:hypothetical protein